MGTEAEELGENTPLGRHQEVQLPPAWAAFPPHRLFPHPPLGVSTSLTRICNSCLPGVLSQEGESRALSFQTREIDILQ